ncbi:MAG: hypothetical protein Q7W55_10395 [Pseudohongiella sp.]|nr:hypothetical protein [Pseudohongiella sp.]
MKYSGTDLRRAAEHLRTTGVGASDRLLRELLVGNGAIRKTEFGYEVTPRYRDAGFLTTQTRYHMLTSHTGQQIHRQYTVVLVTDNGLTWLRGLVMEAAPTARMRVRRIHLKEMTA